MEEKKLTDEEIVKALEICYNTPCCTNDCPYFNKNGRNFCMEGKAFYKNFEDLINRQKAQIERLTEENKSIRINCENARNITGQVLDKNDELQKQVDELTKPLYDEDLFNLGYAKAVKDTAKEILTEVLSLCKNAKEKLSIMFSNKLNGYGVGYKNSVEHFTENILKIAKEKGVEVE